VKVKTWHGLAAGLAVLWLFVRGVTLDPRVILSELLLGVVFGLPVAFLFRRLYPEPVDVERFARSLPYAALYFVAFVYELLTANVDVALRVLLPGQRLDPRVIELPLRVQTPLAITTIANSITLTPGTLTMDHDDATNTLYVHAIAGADRDAVVDPIRRWEDYALVIFDEERKAGDPVPTPRTDASRERSMSTGSTVDDGGDRDGE
jgi:multicomponent Na+:H+ antiporter subunit E